jgi:hypothetical protein
MSAYAGFIDDEKAPSFTSIWPFSTNTMETRSFMAMGLRGGSMIIPVIRGFERVGDLSGDRL